MKALSPPVPWRRLAGALAASLALASSATRAGDLPEHSAPAYHGIPYERLSVPTAAYGSAMRVPEAQAASAGASGPPYRIVNLAMGFAQRSGETQLPIAIDRVGRVLLAGYRLGPAGGLLGNDAVIVTPDGASLRLGEHCPACDPAPSSRSTFTALALNDAGDIVGSWHDALPGNNAGPAAAMAYDLNYFVRWSLHAGAVGLAQLGFATRDAAYAVNARGIAVGQDGTFAATFSRDGRAVQLGTLQGTACDARATAIDDAGTIAGFACAGDASVAVTFPAHGAALPVAGARAPSAVEAINAAGTMAGFAGAAAAVWARGRTTYLPLPAQAHGANAVAYAITAAGDVAGDVYHIERDLRAVDGFLSTRGRTYYLDSLLPHNSEWRIVHVTAMNDAGYVVGLGVDRGVPAPFLMVPLRR